MQFILNSDDSSVIVLTTIEEAQRLSFLIGHGLGHSPDSFDDVESFQSKMSDALLFRLNEIHQEELEAGNIIPLAEDLDIDFCIDCGGPVTESATGHPETTKLECEVCGHVEYITEEA